MHALTAHPDVSPGDRLGATALFAVLAHLIVILGVTFAPEDHPERRPVTLDVVLAPPGSEVAPDRPDYLAPTNQDGGGDSVEKSRPEIAEPPPPASQRPAMAATAVASATGTPPVEPGATTGAGRAQFARSAGGGGVCTADARAARGDGKRVRTGTAVPTPAAAPFPVRDSDAAPPVSRSAALAALSAEIERKLLAHPQRPRRKWISARTQAHEFAAYMDAWRRKVERVGNLNYPDDAARRGLSGSLLLEVAVNPDGTVEDIALRRSSGQQALDDAAVHIVNLAAPFARFPETIAQEVDVLHIQRTWIFRSRGANPESVAGRRRTRFPGCAHQDGCRSRTPCDNDSHGPDQPVSHRDAEPCGIRTFVGP